MSRACAAPISTSVIGPYVREANEGTTSWITKMPRIDGRMDDIRLPFLLGEKRKLPRFEPLAGRVSPRQAAHGNLVRLQPCPDQGPSRALTGDARLEFSFREIQPGA